MKTRIIYIVVDTRQALLYKEDGSTITIQQGDARLAGILETALPIVANGGVAEIDLSEPADKTYDEFSQQTGGFVRFFSVAKKKLAKLFKGEEDKVSLEELAGSYGSLPEAISDIMANAKPPVTKPAADETVVAVVGDKLVPNANQVKKHIDHSVALGSTKGMENFFRRIAAVIDTRAHSVEDLLRFMQKGDLPVADDGTIIAYKLLSDRGGHFVDCHTGRVQQRVGSLVKVSEDLVDRNRKNECSNGLHIARRDYLGSFHGRVCTLVKIAPEDVVTVPHNDPRKVRVCAYHIVGQISANGRAELLQNRPMTDPEDIALLAAAISGKHVGVIETVEITGQQGQGVQITPAEGVQALATAPAPTAPVKNAVVIDTENEQAAKAPAIAPKDINKKVAAAKPAARTKKETAAVLVPKIKSRREQAAEYVAIMTDMSLALTNQRTAAAHLLAYKKAQKVSWDSLGVAEADKAMMDKLLASQPEEPKIKASKKVKDLSARMKAGQAKEPKAPVNDNPKAVRDAEVTRLIKLGRTTTEIHKETGVPRRTVDRIRDRVSNG